MPTNHVARATRPAKAQGERVAHSTAFEWLARSGFVARGLVYGIIGVLAFKLALGDGGKTTNQQGALKTIAHQSFGQALLTLVAIGLGGYALWRLVRAAIGHGPEAGDSTFDRLAGLASGIAYAALCVTAIQILSGSASNSGKASKPAAGVLGWTGGVWIVGATGAIIFGVGIYQAHKGISKDFLEDSKVEQMSQHTRKAFTTLGMIGYAARGFVFGLIGYFLVKAAIDYSPSQAVGLDGALARLQSNSYGPFLLGIVAAGLIAFASYSLADARYRRL